MSVNASKCYLSTATSLRPRGFFRTTKTRSESHTMYVIKPHGNSHLNSLHSGQDLLQHSALCVKVHPERFVYVSPLRMAQDAELLLC
jgi:hypothetical protein